MLFEARIRAERQVDVDLVKRTPEGAVLEFTCMRTKFGKPGCGYKWKGKLRSSAPMVDFQINRWKREQNATRVCPNCSRIAEKEIGARTGRASLRDRLAKKTK